MAEIVLQNPWALSVVLPLAWLVLIVYSWRRRFKPFGAFLLRLAMIVLLALALARPTIVPTLEAEELADTYERLVVLVDQSASVGAQGQQILRDEASRLVQGRNDAFVIYFADQPVLVNQSSGGDPQSAETTVVAERLEASLDSTVSNLADSLAMGAELLNDQPGRLILLSDGIPTEGDTTKVISQLAEGNTPVDVLVPDDGDLQAWQMAQNDVQVTRVSVPPVLRQGEPFNIDVIIHSQAPTNVTLNVQQPSDGTVLAEDVVNLELGLNRFSFNVTADQVGPKTFRATIAADEDSQPANNSLSAFTQVYPTPRILVVTNDAEDGNYAAGLLQSVGYEVQMMRPADVSSRLSELEPFDGMILINVSAKAFQLEQMIAIKEFVRTLGRGLVVAGGRDSFDLGHYDDTPLEELLPVSLEPPPREERPPVALLLILDHSGSMVEEHGQIATRLTMAKEATIRALDFLGPEDLIGILMFDNKYEWVVPFQQVSQGVELLEIQQKIARIPGGGSTRMLKALNEALPAFIEQDTAASRLAVLLTDGEAQDRNSTIEDYNEIIDRALAADITLSTIAIGVGADVELAEYLAERGQGRYHFAEYPEDLPALTISESDILRTNALQEGEFTIAVSGPHPAIRGLFSSAPEDGQTDAPNISGYLAMTPKPESEVVLQIGPGDPLLATWGYGLGRVAAWSSDAGKEWTADWRNWPEFGQFWGQVVGYTLPAPNLGLLQVDASIEPDGTAVLIADGVTSTGQPVDFADTQATLITPGGQETPIRLQQVAPGRYERRVRLADPGAYQLTVNQARSDGVSNETTNVGFVLPYPAEYGLPAENSGQTLLTEIAATTGGSTFVLGESLPSTVIDIENISNLAEPEELWPWFVLGALILWPVEIAWRRWALLRIQ